VTPACSASSVLLNSRFGGISSNASTKIGIASCCVN
jgi:hypothetical protein